MSTDQSRLKVRAVADLTDRGWHAREIQRLLSLSERQVRRYRAVGREVVKSAGLHDSNKR